MLLTGDSYNMLLTDNSYNMLLTGNSYNQFVGQDLVIIILCLQYLN